MIFRKLLILALPIISLLISCTTEHSKIIVADYGKYDIAMGEFEAAYAKNSGGIEAAKDDSLTALKKFLDLYVNYKMKLRDAVVRGYTVDPDMQKELIEYKKNIGGTLFLEEKLFEPGMKEIYERRKTEIHAAHLLLLPDSLMNDDQVVELGNQLIQRINNGESFEDLVKEYSKDTYTKDRGGVVGWVTSGLIVSVPLENAIYNTEPGKIYPDLVKSQFGYHILKALNKGPRKPQIKAQHILAAFRDSTGNVDSVKALEKIELVQKKLSEGEDFGKLAFEYSDDKASGIQNGNLGYFTRGRMVPEFENTAFNLEVNEISPIIKTSFGYHIIKLNEIQPLPTYEAEKEELKEMFQRVRHKEDYKLLMNKLKAEFNYIIFDDSYNKLLINVDSIKVGASYNGSFVNNEFGPLNIFKVNKNNYSIDSLFGFLQYKGAFLNRSFDKTVLDDAIEQFANEKLIEEKAMVYDKEDIEFEKLMNEYEKGIYLFKILEEEIWSKVVVDSVMIENYYNKNKENFKWKNRVEFKEIYVTNDSLANNYYSIALSGYDFDSLSVKYTQRRGYENMSGYSGLVEIDANELAIKANALDNIGDISPPFPFQDGWSIVKLVKRESARIKTLDEAQAEIASLLQESESKRLEDNYLNKLRSIYQPNLYYDKLEAAFKN
jgi:peptidyl-prolyl cis-trans isomerase SurA